MRKTITAKAFCKTCGHITHPATYELRCDNCNSLMDENKVIPLRVWVFYHPDSVEEFEFDSWRCVRVWILKNYKRLLKNKKANFMTIEYVSFNQDKYEQRKYVGGWTEFVRDFMRVTNLPQE